MAKEPMAKVSLRVPRKLWDRAKQRADEGKSMRVTVALEGDETISEAIRKFLERFSR